MPESPSTRFFNCLLHFPTASPAFTKHLKNGIKKVCVLNCGRLTALHFLFLFVPCGGRYGSVLTSAYILLGKFHSLVQTPAVRKVLVVRKVILKWNASSVILKSEYFIVKNSCNLFYFHYKKKTQNDDKKSQNSRSRWNLPENSNDDSIFNNIHHASYIA